MFLTCDNGLISAIFLRNLCVQKPKPVRSLRMCVTIDQCESARNNRGTTKHALFDARCPSREPTLSHQMSQGMKKSRPDRDSNPGPLAHRAITLPTELPSHLVDL